jgi:ribonuclease HI
LSADALSLVVHVDGGARGNPGPAATGVVIESPGGDVLYAGGETIGVATNNVAEYRALITGLERARALGVTEVDVLGDSTLVINQVNGTWKIKEPHLRPLREEAVRALRAFDRWTLRHVPRAKNADADALVNQALDAAA